MSRRHLYENGIKEPASLSLRDTLHRCCSLMSDWDSHPAVFCQHGAVWSRITQRDQTGHHTFDCNGLCVWVRDVLFHVNLERSWCLCAEEITEDHFRDAKEKQEIGISSENKQTFPPIVLFLCLTKRMIQYISWLECIGCTLLQCIMGYMECPKEGRATLTASQNGIHHSHQFQPRFKTSGRFVWQRSLLSRPYPGGTCSQLESVLLSAPKCITFERSLASFPQEHSRVCVWGRCNHLYWFCCQRAK